MMLQHSEVYMMMNSHSANTNDQIPEMTWDQIWDLIDTALMIGIVISIEFPKEAEDEYEE